MRLGFKILNMTTLQFLTDVPLILFSALSEVLVSIGIFGSFSFYAVFTCGWCLASGDSYGGCLALCLGTHWR